jgi:hypothetical protein
VNKKKVNLNQNHNPKKNLKKKLNWNNKKSNKVNKKKVNLNQNHNPKKNLKRMKNKNKKKNKNKNKNKKLKNLMTKIMPI